MAKIYQHLTTQERAVVMTMPAVFFLPDHLSPEEALAKTRIILK